jgi:hypothetical protein
MTNSKANDTVNIRKLIQGQGKEVMDRMLAKLKTTKDLFQSISLTEWLPMDKEDEILQAAAEILYPADPKPVRKLGGTVAKINFSGVYKVFFRIATVAFMAKRISALWHTFFDSGEAHCEDLTDHSVVLVVTQMPDLTPLHREYVLGYIDGILGMTSAKRVEINHDGRDPKAWKWEIKWSDK